MNETATKDDLRKAPAIDSVGQTAIALQNSKLTREQIDLLKKTVAKGSSDDEFALFIELCNHTGLNPFARQIYCLQRRTKNDAGEWVNAMVAQTGIDGLRLIAERTGKYRGQTIPLFADRGGNERKVWLDPKVPPVACIVGILKEGFTEPLFAVALYEEYVQRTRDGSPNKMWKEKPTIMLAKCAEALALRKAFPQELSGIYAEDEMPPEHEDAPEPQSRVASSTRPREIAPVANTPEGTASVDADGDIVVTFGEFKNKKLREVPTSWLLKNFRDPWQDEPRRKTATERLGAGFVAGVYALLLARDVPGAMTVRIATLIERSKAGEVLPDAEAIELSDWSADHQPSAPADPAAPAPAAP